MKETSMKKILSFALMMLFVFAFVHSSLAIHETIPADTQIPEPGPNGVKLYEYIMKLKPYADWQLFPGKDRMYPGTQPHGSFLTTYVNDAAYYSLKDKKGMSDGSIIAKENYTADKKLNSITVMYKIIGYNPKAGDWFWAKYGPGGNVIASGKVEACITCHESKKENDYIYSGAVKN
jgi:hypothetical protein